MPGKFHLKIYDSEPTACMMLSYDNKLHMCNIAVKQPAGFMAIKLHMCINMCKAVLYVVLQSFKICCCLLVICMHAICKQHMQFVAFCIHT